MPLHSATAMPARHGGFCRRGLVLGPCASVVHGSDVSSNCPHPRSRSGKADVVRASQLQHAVEDIYSYVNLSRTMFVQTRAQVIADHLVPAPDCRSTLALRL